MGNKKNNEKYMVLTTKVFLNKCFAIKNEDIKDKNRQVLEMDMNKAKELIKEANLASCMACNKSANMWADYYFTVRRLAEENIKNMSDEEFNSLVEQEFNKRKNNITDKSKLDNEKYISKIRESSIKKVRNNLLSTMEKEVIKKEYLDVYGKTYANVIQEETKRIMYLYNTSNVGTLDMNNVQIAFSGLNLESILSYESSIPSFKKDTPYFFKNDAYKLYNNIEYIKNKKPDENKVNNRTGYYVGLSFFSKEGFNKYNLKNGTRLYFQIEKMDNGTKAIINNILNDNYKQADAFIKVNNKGKIELSIRYKMIPKANKDLDKNRILGIDLGIVKVATMSIWDNNKSNIYGTNGDWELLRYCDRVIEGDELIKYRQKQYNIRKKSQVSKKWSGDGRIGHGVKTRVKGIYNDYTSNFADTYNHKISRYIVDFAVKNNCGVIQMEDLTGATSKSHESFLKEWTYYDLQSKIMYKAKVEGIEVIKVNPRFTSKRCSKCGCIDVNNRDGKVNQGKFECVNCGHTENADINASKNIAIPHIDEIIKNTEVQGKK